MNDLIREYEQLKKQLKASSDGRYANKFKKENYSVENAIKNSSTKHHYLPQYYINGFLGNDGLLSIYDKERSLINKDRKGSGGVFFEKYRNSTDLGFSKPISLMEEAYGVIDNLLPVVLKILRSDSEGIDSELFIEIMAMIDIFIIDIYWRNINTDNLFDYIYENGALKVSVSQGVNLSSDDIKDFKKLPGIKQLVRFKMVIQAISEAIEKDQSNTRDGKIISFPADQICIGDFPFLFPIMPKTNTDLNQLPVIIPISKSKIYLRDVEREKAYDFTETCMFNALIIEHSSKYICSGNQTILKSAIDYYNFAKENDCFDFFRKKLFFN